MGLSEQEIRSIIDRYYQDNKASVESAISSHDRDPNKVITEIVCGIVFKVLPQIVSHVVAANNAIIETQLNERFPQEH
jgi:hypothetical protein